MEKYVFLKNVSLGFIRRNVTAGQTIQFYNGYAILNGQKITDLRDFDILKKYKLLSPYDQKVVNQVSVKKEKVVEKQNTFGFHVKKESEQSNIIPLKKFQKAIQLNQKDTFVQQDGIIKDQKPQGVHVAAVQTKDDEQDSIKQEQKEQLKEQLKEQSKKTEKKDNKKNTKKSNVKNSKQQKQSTVRGMKIIKEN